MEPWKERFVKEYWELDDRINKLNNMLDDWIRGVLKFEPKSSNDDPYFCGLANFWEVR